MPDHSADVKKVYDATLAGEKAAHAEREDAWTAAADRGIRHFEASAAILAASKSQAEKRVKVMHALMNIGGILLGVANPHLADGTTHGLAEAPEK